MAKKKAQPAPHHRKHLNKGEHGGKPGEWHGPSCPHCGQPYAVDAFVGREGQHVCSACARRFEIADALPERQTPAHATVKATHPDRKVDTK